MSYSLNVKREVFLLSPFLAPDQVFCTTSVLDELTRLSGLIECIRKADTVLEKLELLSKEEVVQLFLSSVSLSDFSLEERFVLLSVVAIGQEKVFCGATDLKRSDLTTLLETLLSLESFYREIGGVIGYQLTLLQFLCKPKRRFAAEKASIHAPCGLDFSKPSDELKEAIYYAIEKMEELSEMYPIGGAADRLKLQDVLTGSAMPAAFLSFNGDTLLGRLIGDLQVREYLYYKIKGKQITIPVAMMTSEKENHENIMKLFAQEKWFFRPREKFAFFSQPLVPVVDREGNWIVVGPMDPLLKPGGHGVIWKLARDQGVFSWLREQGAVKSIIRQINNPISSEDYGLLAFSGYGLKEDKRFGFASCERLVNASEGINVVVEEEVEEGFSYALTNIEYSDFTTYNIQDEPAVPGLKYSKFPSNTNLLFVNLQSVEQALDKCPIPGMLVNLKKITFYDCFKEKKEAEVARLESTMQNIADCFQTRSSTRLPVDENMHLDAYIIFNKRRKTISATKKEYVLGSSFLETPEGCFLDVMSNARELLEEHCGFSLAGNSEEVESFTHPSFVLHYHPALGPLYALIGKKVRGGRLSLGSELILHIAECDIENLHIEGSFHVVAERVMGEVDQNGVLRYSEKVGRCVLKNVTIQNQGIDYDQGNVFWKQVIHRKGSFRILLEGESEFYAEDVTFNGDLEIKVEHGHRIIAKNIDGQVIFFKERLRSRSWEWSCSFNQDKTLVLEKVFL